MKRKKKTLEGHTLLKPVRLYLDDLEHIIERMERDDLGIIISDTDSEYESLEEISEYRGSVITNISITGRKKEDLPYIQISFSCDNIALILHGEDEKLTILWHEFKGFLKSKFQWHQFILNPWIWLFVLLGSPAILVWSMVFGAPTEFVIPTYFIFLGCASVPLLISYLLRQYYPLLYLDRRHKIMNFWQRNRDNIFLLIIGGLLGATIKWLLDRLFQ